MTDTQTELPAIPALIASLTERADVIGAELGGRREALAAQRAAQVEARASGKAPKGDDPTDGFAAGYVSMLADSRLSAADRDLAAVREALEVADPETLPDDPASLEGDELAQAVIAGRVIAALDSQRDEAGHLPSRAAQAEYAAWRTHMETLEAPVRASLEALGGRLEAAADRAASLNPPGASEAPRTEKRGRWR